jgi:hypothetical protein
MLGTLHLAVVGDKRSITGADEVHLQQLARLMSRPSRAECSMRRGRALSVAWSC